MIIPNIWKNDIHVPVTTNQRWTGPFDRRNFGVSTINRFLGAKYDVATENGHRNIEVSHEKWWIFP